MNKEILQLIAILKKEYPDYDESGRLDQNPLQLVISGDKQEVIDFMDIFNLVKNMTCLQDLCIKSKNNKCRLMDRLQVEECQVYSWNE